MELVQLSINPFCDTGAVFLETPHRSVFLPDHSAIDLSKLEEFQNKLIIVNMSTEHWNGFGDTIYQQLEENNYNFLLLSHNPLDHLKFPRMLFFPYWYYHSKKNLSAPIPLDNKHYWLGCLNGNPRPHRIANYLILKQKSYTDKISVSFVQSDNPATRKDDVLLTDSELAEWKKIESTLPNRKDVIKGYCDFYNLMIPQLIDSYLHLVAETTVLPKVFITEKTWKPIAAGTLFVIFGNAGIVQFLDSQGVDTYQDIIDHKYYDTEPDWRLRLQKIHNLIDDLMLQGIDKIYASLTERRLNNQQRFFTGEFDSNYLKDIVTNIEKYS